MIGHMLFGAQEGPLLVITILTHLLAFLHTYNQGLDQYPLALHLHSIYTTSSIQHMTTLDKKFYNGKQT